MHRDHGLAVAADDPDVVIDLTYVSTAFQFAASVKGTRDSIRTTLRLDALVMNDDGRVASHFRCKFGLM